MGERVTSFKIIIVMFETSYKMYSSLKVASYKTVTLSSEGIYLVKIVTHFIVPL